MTTTEIHVHPTTKWYPKTSCPLGRKGDEWYYLVPMHFECDWYWGGGYVDSNKSHRHFDSLFLNGSRDCVTMFKQFFDYTPFTDKQIYTLCELMKTFYTLSHYSDLIYRGSSGITENIMSNELTNMQEYKRINEVLIPELNEKICTLFCKDLDEYYGK